MLVAVACLVIAVISAAARDGEAARWYEDFERAVGLIDSGECSREAIQLLGAAVVDKPKPRRSARTIALKTINYFPYFQLARAHLACGEIDAARDYIFQSRQRGIAPPEQLDELERRVDRIRDAAPASGAEPVDTEQLAQLANDAQTTIRQAVAASERLGSRRSDPRLAAFFAERRDRLETAAADLSSAQAQLNEAILRRDRAAIEGVEQTAARALEALTGLERDLERIPTPRPSPEPTVRRVVPRTSPAAVPTAAATRATPTPSPRPTARPVPARTTGGEPSRPAAAESLRRAAEAFVSADYDAIVSTLAPEDYRGAEQRAAAHLLRGAAHFALYCLDGRDDGDRLERARRDIARTVELEPSLRPDPRFFSPEFIALFP